MNIKDFYTTVKGSFDTFISFVGNEEKAKKYIKMFKNDESMNNLIESVKNHDYEAAFRSVHTLKGISANLALDDFHDSCCELTEIFRKYNGQDFQQEFEIVKEKYQMIIDAIDLLE